jgi:hypothetical protein
MPGDGILHAAPGARELQPPGVLPPRWTTKGAPPSGVCYHGGVPKRRREAVRREFGVLRENLFLPCPARGQLEHELDAETRAANTWLAVENQRIGDGRVSSYWSCLSAMSGRAPGCIFAPWPLGLWNRPDGSQKPDVSRGTARTFQPNSVTIETTPGLAEKHTEDALLCLREQRTARHPRPDRLETVLAPNMGILMPDLGMDDRGGRRRSHVTVRLCMARRPPVNC